MEWHAQSGLVATFVEAPLELQKSLSLSALSNDPWKDFTETESLGHTSDIFPTGEDGHNLKSSTRRYENSN